MIHVIAIITAQPGQRAAILEAFQANVPNVHAEMGCLEYQATVDSTPALKMQTDAGPDTFIVVEKWESLAALEAHSNAPHMAAYSAKTRDLVANRTIHVMAPLS